MVKTFNCKNLLVNITNEYEENGFKIKLFHSGDDPATANRIRISNGLVELELLPSKGFSLGQAWINDKTIFWEAPTCLPDTETLDLLSDEVYLNGNPAPGFTFLKTFVAGIEMYGLKNWGMPVIADGKLQPLHGETSNIPVHDVRISVEAERCIAEAFFIYRTFEGDSHKPWYDRGEALYKVTKKIILYKGSYEFNLEDGIENISNRSLIPDWGYHITFRPEDGAKFKVPSKKAVMRGGNPLPADIQTWHKAVIENRRTETGILHKNIERASNGLVKSVLLYPDRSGIEVSTTPSPYFQTWFCNGGKGSNEFTDSNGDSLLHKNWDGMGIEIGSSALDHDGNTDESLEYIKELEQGEKKEIKLGFRFSLP